MYERILVPLDASKLAEIPLPYAEELAATFGSEIILIIVSESNAVDIDHHYRSYLERVTKQVQSHLKDYGAKGDGQTIDTKAIDKSILNKEENEAYPAIFPGRGLSGAVLDFAALRQPGCGLHLPVRPLCAGR